MNWVTKTTSKNTHLHIYVYLLYNVNPNLEHEDGDVTTAHITIPSKVHNSLPIMFAWVYVRSDGKLRMMIQESLRNLSTQQLSVVIPTIHC